MTPRQTPAQVAAQALLVAEEARADAKAALTLNQETNVMVKEIHDAWMKPHPVYGNKSLLDVISNVAARASAGEIVGQRIIFWSAVVAAMGAISAAFYAAVHFGQAK